ncbi:MAG: hypothetical protein GF404_13825 [candidate division Zixibacteria bacterium]|nr:hypothetical protein [candidate division Zixibacteria bacterium]
MQKISEQPEISALFERLIQSGRLASSYLFYGPAGCGKWKTARAVCARFLAGDRATFEPDQQQRVLNLNHPDLSLIYPLPPTRDTAKGREERDKYVNHYRDRRLSSPYSPVTYDKSSSIHLDDIRDFQRHISRAPVESDFRTAIIDRAEASLPAGFDILLKTIEEPPPNSLIILVSDNYERLPETIRSRCQKIRFKRIETEAIALHLRESAGLSADEADLMARLSFGSLARAEELADSDFLSQRETAVSLLAYLFTRSFEKFWLEFTGMINFFDRNQIDSLLAIWQTLYHDIALKSAGAGDDKLLNRDLSPVLTKLAKEIGSFEHARHGLGNLLSLKRLFYRNLSPELAFYETTHRLKKRLPTMPVRDR